MDQKKALLKEWLVTKFGSSIIYAAIHGSYLYGTFRPDSDIDLYLVFENEQKLTDIGNSVSFHEEKIGHIDITYFSKLEFVEKIKVHNYYTMEAIFIPPEFVIIGDGNEYRKDLQIYPPYIRTSFGQICRNAWNRGCKKLVLEKDEKEHLIGKKSLYHCLRIFVYADQLYRNGTITFDDPRCTVVNRFYSDLINKPASELVENEKLKEEYQNIYKQYDKTFKEIPNEEQWKQLQKKKS